MKVTMLKAKNLLATAAFACTAAAPCTGMAQTADDWRFHAILYGYFPSIGGSTAFPNAGSPVNVSTSQIIDNLKGVFMGTFEMQKGRWGAFTDLLYMNVGGSKSQTRDISIGGLPLPGGVNADLNMDLKGWLWTIAGEYAFSVDPAMPAQVLLGARLIDVEEKLGWQTSGNIGSIPLPGRQGNVSDKASNWDAIIGVKGRFAFGNQREWFVPYYFDVGTGQSDLTWQAIGGIGYAWKWGEVIAAWRYLDYNFKSGSAIKDLNFNGPAIGVGFRW
jgi:hypothetical protein